MMQLRSFLGTCNLYRLFIKDFSQMVEFMNRWLRKDVNPTWNDPPYEKQQAFHALKHRLVEPPVVELSVDNRPFLVDKKSWAYQIGVTFIQEQDDDNPKNWATIGCWSHSLTDVKLR